jgi:acyl-CoA thioesterase
MSERMDERLNTQRVAEAVGVGMLANDRASRALGMTVDAIAPGSATLSMPVRDDMLNGFEICHGGFITLLADSAFAFACNSRNALTVAAGLNIEFIASAQRGDVLTARADEVHLNGRTGLYDIEVVNQRGERVAMVRGRSHRMKDREVVTLDDACFAPEPLPER